MTKVNHWKEDRHSDWQSCKRKRRYRNESDARRALKYCRKKRGVELDFYYCNRCGGYHLTSRINWEVKKYV